MTMTPIGAGPTSASAFSDVLTPSAATAVSRHQLEIGVNNPVELGGRLVTITGIAVKDEPLTTILLITDVTERKVIQEYDIDDYKEKEINVYCKDI